MVFDVYTYLAILKREDQRDLVSSNLLVGELRGHPALGRVWLPGPGADFENVSHCRRRLVVIWSLCVLKMVAVEAQGGRLVTLSHDNLVVWAEWCRVSGVYFLEWTVSPAALKKPERQTDVRKFGVGDCVQRIAASQRKMHPVG